MGQILLQVLYLFAFDAIFLGVLAALLIPLALTKHAAFAVLKRNFVGYFSNPTGYVFLWLFVLLTSFAAFWTEEFFVANLANLDQLTYWLPGIMLIFIPAITMSIWAEERRQGTDELLLTIPADDFDIVLGKYLAAAAIFTCSLLFSQWTSFAVLVSLTVGDLDTGLFITTYLGYWFVGLMMLAVGMMASFLTSNLTVGFVFGALFNVPLVVLVWADAAVASGGWAQMLAGWSITAQLDDFARGVISLSSVTYFVLIGVMGIYLSMVLIGRRHWLGGRDGDSMLGHYFLRIVALVVIAFSANVVFSNHDLVRIDATDGQVSSLSRDTKKLMRELDPPHTIYVEAFVSHSLPDVLARTRIELISLLRELDVAGGSKVEVTVHDNLELFDEAAVRAQEQFKIEPVPIRSVDRGEMKQKDFLLGAVFTCGLQRVVVPFFSYGVPVEYELVRSVETVADEERKQIGVLRTDAELFGGLDFMMMQPRPRQLILDELEKQYEVVDVDPNNPIEKGTYDALLVVQPSSLTQPQADNLIDAIQAGQPTALFEDPFPVALRSAPGTSQPKRPPGGMMGQRQPPEQKGDIQQLWNLLGVEMVGEEAFSMGGGNFDAHIVWQQYNPYPKVSSLAMITDQWVFASPSTPGARDAMNPDEPVVSGLEQLLFLFPGAFKPAKDPPEGVQFTPLVTTGDATGVITFEDLRRTSNQPDSVGQFQDDTSIRYVLASLIRSTEEEEAAEDESSAAEEETAAEAADAEDGEAADEEAADEDDSADDEPQQRGLKVILASDIDLLHSDFISLRAQPDSDINWQFDNVTFVLNVLDFLAGDDRFMEIRTRTLRHSTLRMVELQAAEARKKANEAIEKAREKSKEAEKEAEEEKEKALKKTQDRLDDLQKKVEEEPDNMAIVQQAQDARILLEMQRRAAEAGEAERKEEIKRDLSRDLALLDRELELNVDLIRNNYKLWAVILPPLPPLIVAFVVFMHSQLREREGVTRSRLR